MLSTLEKLRLSYVPKIPDMRLKLVPKETPPVAAEIAALFPAISNFPVVRGEAGNIKTGLLRVGILFSGGPAAGGHNVVCGLFDALKKLHPESKTVGFLGGPAGLVGGKSKEITAEALASFRNQGGFDLLGTGRTKVETPEQFEAACQACKDLDGLVIVGGDDSNTNAALLADYFLKKKSAVRVVGVPKTIDGDLQNGYVPLSFGFDTACKIYSEMIGNIARDAVSAGKYYHFIKLMGRSASHIALECAMATHPNLTLISEEKKSLPQIVSEIVDLVQRRAAAGKNYGVILIPEGLAEAMPDIPKERDPHGNVTVSAIETEQLLIEAVKPKVPIHPVRHFLGYEGRCGLPTNFDADYTYALGGAAALLIASGRTGYMAFVSNLAEPPEKWSIGGAPLSALLHIEERAGKRKPVIAKAYVDLSGFLYRKFLQEKEKWALDDDYCMPGPIQYFGSPEAAGSLPLTLAS